MRRSNTKKLTTLFCSVKPALNEGSARTHVCPVRSGLSTTDQIPKTTLVEQYMRFKLNSPNVVEEVIDGEAMVVHLVSGIYYNMVDHTAQIWRCILQGASLELLTDHYARLFPDSEQAIKTELSQFIDTLISEGLILDRSDEVDDQAEWPGRDSGGQLL